MKLSLKLALVFLLLMSFSALLAAAPSAKWMDTYIWLKTYYNFPKTGPNYDWPDSGMPKVLSDNTVMLLDGTKLPVVSGAYEVNLQPGGYAFKYAGNSVNIKYRVKFSNAEEAKNKFDELVELTSKHFKVDLLKFKWSNEGSVVIKDNIDKVYAYIIIPGKRSGNEITFPDESDYFIVEFALFGYEHFYFDRWNLRVADKKVALSDGTVFPLVPFRKVAKVQVGNMQGDERLVVVTYQYTVYDKSYQNFKTKYENEFEKIYKFYGKHFGFADSDYKIWDQDMIGFILTASNSKVEIRITATGKPEDNGLRVNTDAYLKSFKSANSTQYDVLEGIFSGFTVEVRFKNKKQIIPGTDERLPKLPEQD